MQCVILAGGLAQRMRPLTEQIPKSLLPVGAHPFIHYQLGWLADHGVTDVVLCIGHLGNLIRDYVQDGGRWRVRVRYVDEGPELRGTGGALRLALEQGELETAFLVTYGDSFLPVDFRAIYEAFDPSKDAALMTVFRNRGCWDTSNACFESGRVTLYDKSRKPNGPAELPNFEYIDYGLSALSRRTVADGLPAKERHDLADLFHRLSREGRLAGCEVATRFYEIGSPAGWQDFSEYVTNLPRSFGKEAETLDAAQDLSL